MGLMPAEGQACQGPAAAGIMRPLGDSVGRYHRQPLRGMRKFAMVFWDRPRSGLIYGHLQMDVTKTLRFIEDVKAKHGIAPSMGQVVGRGIALAATKIPEINGKIIWGRQYLKDTVDIYFQVDVEDGKDLSGVTVPDAGRKTIVEIATILRDRANKLRVGQDKQYEKTQKGCLGRVPVWCGCSGRSWGRSRSWSTTSASRPPSSARSRSRSGRSCSRT
jgi:hypothetical protein